MPEKNRIILFSAVAIALLLNIPRILIASMRTDLAQNFGLTYSDIAVRIVVMFFFSWTVLSYNVFWKMRLKLRTPTQDILRDIAINVLLLLAGVITLVSCKDLFFDLKMDTRSYFFLSFFIYLFVLVLLLLLSWLINLTAQHQQSIIEREHAKSKALHHQLEALRAQVNPHFLFNALNSLNSLIRQKSDKASMFVDKLSLLLRATLQQSDKDDISLQEELNYLNAYVFLQKVRFGEKLNIDIRIPDEWKKEMIPSFSLQLLVENVIKHNVISNKQPLEVKVFTDRHFLVVSNPIQKRTDSAESIGMGLSNLSTRFQIMRKEDIQIERTENTFLVKLPIYESDRH